MLSKLARGLVADAETARDAREASTYQSHARQAMAAVQALAKLVERDSDTEAEGVYVTDAAVEAATERAREKMRRIVAAIRKERGEWPRCAACGQPVKPAEGGTVQP